MAHWTLPAKMGEKRHAVDACAAGRLTVLGYSDEEAQLSLVEFGEKVRHTNHHLYVLLIFLRQEVRGPRIHFMKERPHRDKLTCLGTCPQNSRADSLGSFLSGGSDKTIRKWDILAHNNRFLLRHKTLPIDRAGIISSVTWLWNRDGVACSSTNKLHLADLSSHARTRTAHLSNTIHNLHVHSESPNMITVEVSPFCKILVLPPEARAARPPRRTGQSL